MKSNTLFQFVCTTWSYDVCTQQHTEYKYCPVYGDVTYYNDCEKCGTGEKIVLEQTLVCSEYGELPCPSSCDYCFYIGGSKWEGGTTKTGNFNVGFEYDCYNVETYCKTCTITEKIGEEQCGSITVCDKWETFTGESVPDGAKNVQCVDGFESCGNGKCEAQYGEDENTCKVDCGIKVCYPNQYKCEEGILYQCDEDGFDWHQVKTCDYGCKENACCIPKWEIVGDWSKCVNGVQTLKYEDGCGNVKYDERSCVEPENGITLINIVVSAIGILVTLIGIFLATRGGKRKRRK